MAKANSNGGGTKSGGGTKGNNKGITLLGTAGADTLTGGDGNDILDGGLGNDRLFGGLGNDYLVGRDGDDYLDGGVNYDQMDGGSGNDTYVVDHLGDYIIERIDGGTDTVLSSVGWTLIPEVENLVLTGAGSIHGTGSWRDNQLTGNIGDNRLDGREGNDLIDGGQGADTLIGGLGADVFAFTTPLGLEGVVFAPEVQPVGNVDTIVDFAVGEDRIAVDDGVFAGLVAGVLPVEAFRVGTAAEDADDRIIYDSATGNLLYDADGAGGADTVLFATLQPNLPLVANDFIVI